MKKQFLLLLLSFSLSFAHAQVTRYDVPVSIFPDHSFILFPNPGEGVTTICKGDTLTLSLTIAAGGFPYWINTTRDCSNPCTFSLAYQSFQGSGIIWHSTSPAVTNCESPPSVSYSPTCKVAPTQTTTYTIEWFKTQVEPISSCGTQTTLWHYKGTLQVNVVAPPTPIITASTSQKQIKQGESIILRSDCNFPSYPYTTNPFSTDRDNLFESTCGTNTYALRSSYYPPTCNPYTFSSNTVGKRSLIAQKIMGGCASKTSEPLEITVRPCGKSTFGFSDAALETQVRDVETVACDANSQNRSDYHHYELEKSVCGSSQQCNIDNVWQLYKSKLSNQTPLIEYFPLANWLPTLTNFIYPKPIFNPNDPITSGSKVNLASPENFAILTGKLLPGVQVGLGIFDLYKTYSCGIGASFAYSNPIAIHIDESNKCITNYTLPGHILYPGKATRCIVEECGNIKVKTFGEGVSCFGNNITGKIMSSINSWIASNHIFKSMDDSFLGLVNQRFQPKLSENDTLLGSVNNIGIEGINWAIKEFHVKYINQNVPETTFSMSDTDPFWNMNRIKIAFSADGTYNGINVQNQAIIGNWSNREDSIVVDGRSAKIDSISNEKFIIKGIFKSFIDSNLIDAEYTYVFKKQSCDVPIAPSVSNVRTTSATVSWTSTVLGASFVVEYIPSGSPNWIALPSTTNTSINLTGLIGATTYSVRVTTICSPTESSSASVITNFTTAPICNSPTIAVSNITLNSATFSWASVATGTSYIVEYKPSSSTNWITLPTTTNTQISVAGLTSTTAYSVCVTGDCNSSPSSVATFTTLTPCNAPATPSVSNISPTSAIVSWASLGSGVSYLVEYKLTGDPTWAVLPVTTTTSSSLSGLSSSAPYSVRITANCNAAPSGIANFTTKSYSAHPIPVGLPVCLIDDFVQLVQLYDATNGDNWTNKTGWFTDPIMENWYGIDLTASGCDIQYISLNGNNLVGELPMLSFPELLRFQGWNNKLTGAIPNFNMPKLIDFNFQDQNSGGDFTGSIPNFDMPNLKSLHLWGNKLTGSIPNFNMPNLVTLWLDNNLLSGSIPNFAMPLLEGLTLGNNQLTGSIPNFTMPKLTVLNLRTNQLSGTIPDFNMPLLTQYYLDDNKLTGNIINVNMPLLTEFQVSKNLLTGSIPNLILPNLKRLGLHTNQLTGSIPNFNMPLLTQLLLNDNQLTGSVPDFNMPSLALLFVKNNQLTGNLPSLSNTGLVAAPPTYRQFYFYGNKFIFGDMEGKPWLGSMDVRYSPQSKIPTTFNGVNLSVNTGSANNIQQFSWYKNDVLIVTNQSNTYTPTSTGKYYCKISHNTLTTTSDTIRNLILQSEDYINAVIPVELLNFTATPLSKTTQLNWQTASEKNASHFDVEQSSNGKTFDKIGEVKANGNSATLKNYSFIDETPFNGLNYYRLRQVDEDGTATLSNIVSVTFNTHQKLTIFPNPTKDKLTIISESIEDYSIIDVLGHEMRNGTLTGNQTNIDVSNLSAGMYFLKTKTESIKFSKN